WKDMMIARTTGYPITMASRMIVGRTRAMPNRRSPGLSSLRSRRRQGGALARAASSVFTSGVTDIGPPQLGPRGPAGPGPVRPHHAGQEPAAWIAACMSFSAWSTLLSPLIAAYELSWIALVTAG